LSSANSLANAGGTAHAIMQDDGNFVIYQNDGSKAVWSTSSSGKSGDTLKMIFQTDYNLVVYDGSEVLWSSSTMNNDCDDTCRVVLQEDCNLVMYKGSDVKWATNKFCPDYKPPPPVLPSGTFAIKGPRQGKYCADQAEGLVCNVDYIDDWEKFEVVKLSANEITIKGGRGGKYCGDASSGPSCNVDTVGDSQKFTLEHVSAAEYPLTFSIKSGRTGKYCADDSNFVCDRSKVDAWEAFEFHQVFPPPPSPPSPPPPPTCSRGTCGGDWGISFDQQGWSKCNTGCAMTGLERGGGDEIYNLESVVCCAAGSGSTCTDKDISGSFDSAGWALCPSGTYMNGLYRSNGIDLYNIETMHCCSEPGATTSNCVDYSIGSAFDHAGTVECPGDKVMQGMYRSSGSRLYNLETLKCCEYKVPSPSLPPAAASPKVISDTLHTGDTLTASSDGAVTASNSLLSSAGTVEAVMQDDGNFVIYQKEPRKAIWSTSSGGKGSSSSHINFQTDYNFVLYDGSSVLWASHTDGNGCDSTCRLILQDDGNLVMYMGSSVKWASHSSLPH
jgi:hypothetical protein